MFWIDRRSTNEANPRMSTLLLDIVLFALQGLLSLGCVAATISLLLYSLDLRERDAMDYQGLMRITNVTRYEEYRETPCKGAVNTMYRAILQVDWGHTWGCPTAQPPVACTDSNIRVCPTFVCDNDDCQERARESAQERLVACVRENYIDLRQLNTYTAYDPLAGPSLDVDWPHLVAYGNCDTCEISTEIPSLGTMRKKRVAGLYMLGSCPAGLLAIMVVWWQRCLGRRA